MDDPLRDAFLDAAYTYGQQESPERDRLTAPAAGPRNLPEPELRRLAEELGRHVADGRLDEEDGRRAVIGAGSGSPPDWNAIRACWLLQDTASDIARRRRQAERAIRWAVRPLFERQAGKSEIEAAARKANGDVLASQNMFAILVEEARSFRPRRIA